MAACGRRMTEATVFELDPDRIGGTLTQPSVTGDVVVLFVHDEARRKWR